MSKVYYVYKSVEQSDGVYRGVGEPILKGDLDTTKKFLAENWSFDSAFEVWKITLKKGKETKRVLFL